jgi:hypothetical protein
MTSARKIQANRQNGASQHRSEDPNGARWRNALRHLKSPIFHFGIRRRGRGAAREIAGPDANAEIRNTRAGC